MGKRLSDGEIEGYWRDGFASPVEVMGEGEAQDMRRRVEDVEARFGAVHYMVKPYLVMTAADEIAHHTALLDAVEDIIGPDIMLWDAALIIKEPGDNKHVTWHQDLTYWGLDSVDDVVSVWLALSPATVESGTMKLLPGSHKLGQLAHHATDDDNNVLSRGQTVDLEVDEANAVDNVLRPGQMSLHHGLVFHASMPNVSDDRRIGFNMNLINPRVRQLKVENDSAMMLRGEDRHGHFRPEPRPTGDFEPDAVKFQAEIGMARGKEINHDPKGRLVNTVFKEGRIGA